MYNSYVTGFLFDTFTLHYTLLDIVSISNFTVFNDGFHIGLRSFGKLNDKRNEGFPDVGQSVL